MSTTIDQRVVEMRFDNKHFESNVRESMSTLDKLKQKLNLNGAAKGLENINASANKVNMNGLSNALGTVQARFSALEVVGVTALANITNSAVNAGKRIVSALTIDPVKTGFQEYETQINAIQTILSNTRSEGTNVEIVNEALDELNKYADKTIYNFTEMTKNIGTFTAAGVKLDTSVSAIKGIANLAAVSGSTSQQASTAMYQLSQALAAGKVSLMDWNSVVNAGMGGKLFQDALVRTSELLGTGANKAIKMYGSFRESLTKGEWLTTEVLTETLKQLSGAYSKADLIAQGFTEAQAEEIAALAKDAENAATKVKTFTQLWDVLKESAQSGWSKTWRLIIGDFEDAKNLLSPLAEFLTGAIDKFSNARNKLLEGALSFNPFTALMNKLNNSGIGKMANKIDDVSKSLEYYQDMVNKVWRGDYKNQPVRSGLLEAEGHNFSVIQSLVNKGYQYKLTVDDITKAEEKYGVATKKSTDATVELTDAKLKDLGLTDEEIRMYRDLEKQSKKTGKSIDEIIKSMNQKDGRTLLIESFKNIGMSIVKILKSIGQAWRDVFPPMSSIQLYNVIAGLNEFTSKLVMSDETADYLRRTLAGLFSILDIGLTIIGGPIKIAVKILGQLLEALGFMPNGILGLTANVGDAIVAFDKWLDSVLDFTGVFKFLAPYIKSAASAVHDWFVGLKDSETIKKLTGHLKAFKETIVDWVEGLKEAENIPKYILEGLINGLKSGAKTAIDAIITLGTGLIDGIKKILGIHSPSTEFYEIGKNIVQGLFNGISDFIKMVYTLVMSVGSKLTEIIKGLDLGSIFTIAVGAGSVYGFVKFAQAIEALTSPMEAFGDIAGTFNKTLKKFNGVLSAFKFKLYADSLKTFAISIAILAGSVIALTLVDQTKLLPAIGTIAALAVILGVLTAVAGKFGGKEGVQFGKMALTLLALGVAMGLMAGALNKIAKIKPERFTDAIHGFASIMGLLIALMITVNFNKRGFEKLGAGFLGIASALLMMSMVTKMLGKMNPDQLHQGGRAIGMFSIIIIALMAATKLLTGSKNVDKIANTIAKVGTAILMMALVAKLLGNMNEYELKQGVQAIIAFSGIIVGLMAATKLISGSTNVDKIGKAIFGISGALLMMVFVAKIAASMEFADLAKGVLAITAFSGIIVGLMAATKLLTGSKNVDKIGKSILAISVAIGLMAVTAALLGLIDTKHLVKGILAVGILSSFIAGLMYVTKFVPKGIMGTLITITTAIGILALAMGLLSVIKPERLAGATLAIGVLMGMFALIVGVSSIATTSMGTLIVLTVAIGILAIALYKIAELPIEKTMAATIGLSALLLALSGALVMLGVVGTMGPAAFIGIGALATLIVALTAVVVAIGALMEKFPALQSFLNTGLSALIQLAGGLGEMIGAFVGGIMTQISSTLPIIGANLSLFMTNLMPFIAGAKMIDKNVLAGVGILAASIIALTAASLIEGVISLLPFVDSFANLGTQLSAFIMNAMPFIMMSKLIDPAIMDGVKTLAEAILILTGANLIEGISRLLGGESSLDKFGSQLGGLGTSMNQFVTNLGTFDESKLMTVTCATKAIKSLAQAANEIPNEGGLWAKIVGENSIAAFGDKLPGLATSINGFITNLGTFDESKVATVNCACEALKSLASAASEIPNEGGLWASIVGENSIATFGNKLPGLATSLNGFITNLGTFDESKITSVNCACKAIKSLAAAANSIPNEGGLWAKIVGDNSLATFGNKLPKLGSSISSFVSNLGTFSEAQVATVNSACKAIKSIAKLGEIDIKDTGSGLNSFGKNMVKFAKKVKEFVEQVGEVGSKGIDSAINKTKELIKMATTVADTNVSSIKTFGDSLKKFAKDGVKGFVKEFSGVTPKRDAKNAVKNMIDSAIEGAEIKKSDVKKKFKSIAEAAVDALSTKALKADAKAAGKDLVKGFASGISENTYLATAKATAMANAAEKAARNALDINSPSRVFREIGSGIPEGFAQGITMLGSKIKNSVSTMSNTAISGTTKAISRMVDSINMDIDTQPTIRPVLDLSDIESGAGYLNTMFNTNPSIGVMSNLNAISSGMNSLNQNGNGDVVSAIDKMRRDLGNIGGDTYNINGVSVEDDSSVRDAVQTIIRAAVVGRRI